ncbi:MAG: flagellar motor switch protein FliN [Acidimicrobiales bacterium]
MSTGTDLAESVERDARVEALGLRVDPSIDVSLLVTLDGPFITVDVTRNDGTLIACLAVRDSMSEEGEALLASLASSTFPRATASPGQPVATGAGIEERFATPIEVAALTDGTEIRAVVVSSSDRRTPDPGPGPAEVPAAGPVARVAGGFDKLVNVALDVSVELGRTSVTLAEVLEYDVGSVVELDRAAGAPVDVRVNGMLLAQGEVVLVDDEYAVRITAIVDPPSEG